MKVIHQLIWLWIQIFRTGNLITTSQDIFRCVLVLVLWLIVKDWLYHISFPCWWMNNIFFISMRFAGIFPSRKCRQNTKKMNIFVFVGCNKEKNSHIHITHDCVNWLEILNRCVIFSFISAPSFVIVIHCQGYLQHLHSSNELVLTMGFPIAT